MTLDEGDKAIVATIAGEIIERVTEKLILQHQVSCIHGKTLLKSKMVLLGIFIGSGLFSSSIVMVLAKVILKL